MSEIHFTYLSGPDAAQLALTEETILFWHRGLSLSNTALGAAMLDKATRLGLGQRLRFA